MTNKFDSTRENPYTQNLSVQIVLDERDVTLIQSQYIKECFFIEDIFSNCIIGKLVFTDVHGLFERGPLTGNEMISLIYGVEEIRELVFDIWKITSIVQTSPTAPTDESLIELVFVDTSFYQMFVTKYSFSFAAQTPYTTMVDYLLKNMAGWEPADINLEPSSSFSLDPIALPYWTISESSKFLLKRARSSVTSKSGYLIYNSTEEGWRVNVRTLDYLFSSSNVIDSTTFIFEDSDTNLKKKNKIWEWWIEGINKNTMDIARGGVWKGYDSSQKRFINATYSYAQGIKDITALGTKSLYPDMSDTNSFHRLTGESSDEDLLNVMYDSWVKNYGIQQQLNIIVPGNEKRYCGSQIEIEWPSGDRHEFDNKGVQFSKQMKGKYLIKTIINSFVGESTSSNINYIQKIRLLKNAYQESDAESLLNIPIANQNIGNSSNREDFSLLQT